MGAKDSDIKLIVGLGNPGAKYDQTRHNAGFWLVDELARQHGGSFRSESKFQSDVTRVSIKGNDVWLLKPMTFMNRSGGPIRAVSTFYKFKPEEVLVAHDELDLDPGVARFKKGGGHGGHNGLRDTIAQIGKEFLRCRLGIGHPGNRSEVVNFVLQKPMAKDQQAIDDSVISSSRAIEMWFDQGQDKATQWLHTQSS